MVSLFKASYQKETGVPWDVKITVSFENYKISGPSQKRLRNLSVNKIRTSKCNDWDVTLLSALLLFELGYMKGIALAEDAVKKLQEERNSLSESYLDTGMCDTRA